MRPCSTSRFTLVSRPLRRPVHWVLAVLLTPAGAQAHGFAQRYDLPVPLELYVVGAAATVALSFVAIAWFLGRRASTGHYPRLILSSNPIGRALSHPLSLAACRMFSVGLLALVILAGLFGNQNPFKNIAPVTIWVIGWVGLAYVAGLLGNLWAIINPWAAIWRQAERWLARPGRVFGLHRAYPAWLGDWPAVALFVGFVWLELVWPASDTPAALARVVISYSCITWLGMYAFGRHSWLRHGEVFSLVFGLLARFAPTEVRVTNRTLCTGCAAPCRHDPDCINCQECIERAAAHEREWNLRSWAVGLLSREPVSFSRTVFVAAVLSSVTFDGLLATSLWQKTAGWMLQSELLRPLILTLQDIAGDAVAAIRTMALLAFMTSFQLVYLGFSALMRCVTPAATRPGWSALQIAGLFVLSLVPIALAYHLAHYLSYLAIIGQYAIPLASDPLGLGWDLFGTSLYVVNIGVIDARFVWYSSVIAIVAGHIIAVYLAHVTALRTFGDRRVASLSQLPMLVLMIGYTMSSLWILAQPIVE